MYLYLFLLLCGNVVADYDSGEGKYIDLLSEDEKKDFLERIARRILEEVEEKEGLKQSGELTDSQLDKHSSYVSQLLKEEENNLRNKYGNLTKQVNEEKFGNHHNDNITVQGLVEVKVDNEEKIENQDKSDDSQRIDLTLRHGNTPEGQHYKNISKKINNSITTDNNRDKVSIEISIHDNSNENKYKEIENKPDQIPVEVVYDTKTSKTETTTENNHSKESTILRQISAENTEPTTTTKAERELLSLEKRSAEIENINNTQENIEDTRRNDNDSSVEDKEWLAKKKDYYTVTTDISGYEPERVTHSCESDGIEENTNYPGSTTTAQTTLQNQKTRTTAVETTFNTKDPDDFTQRIYELVDISRTKNEIFENNTATDKDKKSNLPTLVKLVKKRVKSTTISLNDVTTDTTQVEKPLDRTKTAARKIERKVDKAVNLNITVDNINKIHSNDNKSINGKTVTQISEENNVMLETSTNNGQMLLSADKRIHNLTKVKTKNVDNKTRSFFEPITNDEKIEHNKKAYVFETTTENIKNIETFTITTPTILNPLTEMNFKVKLDPKTPKSEEHSYKRNSKNLQMHFLGKGLPLSKGLFFDSDLETQVQETYEMESKFAQNNVKEYKVFEVPTEIKTNRKSKENQRRDTAYYAPVYNYAPELAYFNPYNKLGLNAEDIDNKEHEYIDSMLRKEKESSSSEDYSLDDTTIKTLVNPRNKNFESHLTQLLLPMLTKYTKGNDVHFIKYIDADYYHGRSNSGIELRSRKRKRKKKESSSDSEEEYNKSDLRFPDTNEADHPYNLIHQHELKDHISAVRKVLYQKKLFGYNMPTKTTKKAKKSKNMTTETPTTTEANEKGKKYFRSMLKDVFIVPEDNISDKELNNELDVDYLFGDIKKNNHLLGNGKSNKIIILDPKSDETLNLFRKWFPFPDPFEKRGKYNLDDKEQSNDKYNSNGKSNGIYKSNKNNVKKRGKGGTVDGSKEGNNDENLRTKINLAHMKMILDMSDAKDVVSAMLDLQTLLRSNQNKDLGLKPFVNVLRDMIYTNNKALYQYDWLGTAVDIQASISKLLELADQVQADGEIHPSDLELLKYVVYIYKTSENELRSTLSPEFLEKSYKLPQVHKKDDQRHFIKNFKHLTVQRRNLEPDLSFLDMLKDFEEFLLDLQNRLNDLHNALKHIAMVSKYNNVKWFENLRELYLVEPTRKELLEVILHLSAARLIGLLEDSAIHGAEQDFVNYVNSNRKKVIQTREELIFVLKVLGELKFIDQSP